MRRYPPESLFYPLFTANDKKLQYSPKDAMYVTLALHIEHCSIGTTVKYNRTDALSLWHQQ